MTGPQFGHYRLGALLGEGGMGRVYLAEDLHLGRQVALKLMPEAIADSPEMVARFLREARLLATVNHPNVVTVHSVEEIDGRPFFTMEYIEGRTLLEFIQPGGLPWRDLLDIALPLAEGLAAAHARGIVHRDLKPANVMRRNDGRLKILDFGIAKPERSLLPDMTELTRAGSVIGTPAYMAPEQLCGGEIGPQTDLFCCAVLLYELATGSRPFVGASDAELMSAILRDAPRPLSERRRDLPPPLQEILDGCLQKQPARRTANASVLIDQLSALRTASPGRPGDLAPTSATIGSLAVLPLQEIGPDVEDLLADGITEALIANLARSSDLKVISRSSSMRFKGSSDDPRDIAKRLGVDALVTGSVRRAGNRIRISVELVDPSSDRVLWADRYDRELEDVLRLQDDISDAIAAGVQARVGAGRDSPTPQRVDPEVYFLDLKGKYLVEQRTEGSFRSALGHFRQALARDPYYAPSLIGVARAYNMLINYGLNDQAEASREIRTALDRAQQVQANEAEVLGERAHMRWQLEFDWRGAEADFRRALELAPSNARLWYWRGIALGTSCEFDAAQESMARAESLDPLSFQNPAAHGWVMYYARRLPEAAAKLRGVIASSPDFAPSYWLLGMVLESLGEYEEAIGSYEAAFQKLGRISRLLGYLGHACGRVGREQQARALLAELAERAKVGHVPEYFTALVHAGLGDRGAALTSLERAWETRDSMLRDIHVDASFDELRDEPRFRALIANLPTPSGRETAAATRVLTG